MPSAPIPTFLPGDGLIDWAELARALVTMGYSGNYVIEVKGGADPYATLVEARRGLECLLGASAPT